MSQTYSIGCAQCRKHLWIAQSNISGETLYTGDRAIMAELKTFLFAHARHPLVFDENCESGMLEWDEIEPKPEAKP